jgi:archaellum component FlaC
MDLKTKQGIEAALTRLLTEVGLNLKSLSCEAVREGTFSSAMGIEISFRIENYNQHNATAGPVLVGLLEEAADYVEGKGHCCEEDTQEVKRLEEELKTCEGQFKDLWKENKSFKSLLQKIGRGLGSSHPMTTKDFDNIPGVIHKKFSELSEIRQVLKGKRGVGAAPLIQAVQDLYDERTQLSVWLEDKNLQLNEEHTRIGRLEASICRHGGIVSSLYKEIENLEEKIANWRKMADLVVAELEQERDENLETVGCSPGILTRVIDHISYEREERDSAPEDETRGIMLEEPTTTTINTENHTRLEINRPMTVPWMTTGRVAHWTKLVGERVRVWLANQGMLNADFLVSVEDQLILLTLRASDEDLWNLIQSRKDKCEDGEVS